MKRLTFEGNFCDISMCRETPCPYNGTCSQRKVWERLKEYEDREEQGCLKCRDSARMTVTISNKLVDGKNTGWLGGNLPARYCFHCGRKLGGAE